jgi:hypothetical protein
MSTNAIDTSTVQQQIHNRKSIQKQPNVTSTVPKQQIKPLNTSSDFYTPSSQSCNQFVTYNKPLSNSK